MGASTTVRTPGRLSEHDLDIIETTEAFAQAVRAARTSPPARVATRLRNIVAAAHLVGPTRLPKAVPPQPRAAELAPVEVPA